MNEIKVAKPNPFEQYTAEWWYYQLPKPYRKQALENFKNMSDKLFIKGKNDKYDNMADALDSGFNWHDTPEEYDYWWELFIKAENNEPLTEIKVLRPNPFEYRTLEWWLYQLPEPYRTQALNNFKNETIPQYVERKGNKYNDIAEAVLLSFNWNNTPEGLNYWSNMYDKLENNEPLTEIKVAKPNPFEKYTAEWWFYQLPQPYRDQALENTKNETDPFYYQDRYKEFKNILSALTDVFYWGTTPEGHDYWRDLYNKLENNEPLTEIKVVKPELPQKLFTRDELNKLFSKIKDKFEDRLTDLNTIWSPMYKKKDQSLEDYYKIHGRKPDYFKYGTLYGDAISFGFILNNPTEEDKKEIEKLLQEFTRNHNFYGTADVRIYPAIQNDTNVRIGIYHKTISAKGNVIENKKIVLDNNIWENLKNSNSFNINTLVEAIVYAKKNKINLDEYINNIKEEKENPIPIIAKQNNEYHLVEGEYILSLYKGLGLNPTVLLEDYDNENKPSENADFPPKDNNTMYMELFNSLIKKCCDDLSIKLPTIEIIYDDSYTKEYKSYGGYSPDNNTIYIVVYKRTLADVLRTLSHEIYHSYQNSKGILTPDAGKDGDIFENDANAYSGKIMREFGRENPEIYFIVYNNKEQ